jgi:DNA polymerase III delta prime subunit
MFSHHAHFIIGDAETLIDVLIARLESECGILARGNPDVSIHRYDTLKIEDARRLEASQILTSVGGGVKIFIISAYSITHEAQNALLKTLEEPTHNTFFFLIVPRQDSLLPTLKSRLQISALAVANQDEQSKEAHEFLSGSLAARLKTAKGISEAKDKEAAIKLFSSLEREYRRRKSPTLWSRQDIIALEALAQARSYLSDRGSSVKMLLDYIALILPTSLARTR